MNTPEYPPDAAQAIAQAARAIVLAEHAVPMTANDVRAATAAARALAETLARYDREIAQVIKAWDKHRAALEAAHERRMRRALEES